MLQVNISIQAAFSGAPEGILGGFIHERLSTYVEPTRTGTPRGEAIGFSRKKYHAVLLAMTNLPLQKQAKLIGVGQGVLKTWRAEETFLERLIRGCFKDFIDETVPNAGALALHAFRSKLQVIHEGKEMLESDLEKLGGPQGLGFEDSHLYSSALGEMIIYSAAQSLEKAGHECRAIIDQGGSEAPVEIAKRVEEALRWVLPVTRIIGSYAEVNRCKEQVELAGWLAQFQEYLFYARTWTPQDEPLFKHIFLIAQLINQMVTRKPKINKTQQQIRRRTSQMITKAISAKR